MSHILFMCLVLYAFLYVVVCFADCLFSLTEEELGRLEDIGKPGCKVRSRASGACGEVM